MPSLLGDKAAQWLRERMDSGDWKTFPRRLNKTGGKVADADSCCLAFVSSTSFPTGAFLAKVYDYRPDGSALLRTVVVLCPNIGGLTRLAEGDAVILHKCQMDEYPGEDSEEEGKA